MGLDFIEEVNGAQLCTTEHPSSVASRQLFLLLPFSLASLENKYGKAHTALHFPQQRVRVNLKGGRGTEETQDRGRLS